MDATIFVALQKELYSYLHWQPEDDLIIHDHSILQMLGQLAECTLTHRCTAMQHQISRLNVEDLASSV